MSHHFDQSQSTAKKAVYWSLLNGIVVDNDGRSDSVVHAPISLSPYIYPQKAFEEAKSLAPLFNKLVHNIAREGIWLCKTLENTAENDEFTGRLLSIYKEIRSKGLNSPITLGLHRSDYMLHDIEDDPRQLMQVEMNTIAASFGSLSSKISEMHRAVHRVDIPTNETYVEFAKGIAAAHFQYLLTRNPEAAVSAKVVMIVQPGERNIADQWLLQFALLERHDITCLRYSLEEVNRMGKLVRKDGPQGSMSLLEIEGHEVSVVYFRAGYSPNDYPTEAEWAARLLMESSRAVKCPDIAYHLVGAKKVQQALAAPGELERFMTPKESSSMRKVFAGLYSLDEEDSSREELLQVIERARNSPHAFVMKPQREGGGNNLYDGDILLALDTMTPDKLSAYILMERILPPSQQSTLIRRSQTIEADCICELGIFSVYLADENASPREPLIDSYAGYLLRVKPEKENEGGVAAGFAVLSSPYLV